MLQKLYNTDNFKFIVKNLNVVITRVPINSQLCNATKKSSTHGWTEVCGCIQICKHMSFLIFKYVKDKRKAKAFKGGHLQKTKFK